MTDRIELTLKNLLDGLAGEIRSPEGPGAVTRLFNQTLIEEFRANGGRLSGELATSPFLLLTTTGARSGRRRTTPLAYLSLGGRIVIIASKGGAQTHPAWYLNLVAHPEVTVELGEETYPAQAVVIEGSERDRLYAEIASRMPAFADYERRTDRRIPVVELRRADG
jgi:deazaflavin-dependent oxidoreductase (nitroreductase family)